MIIWHKKQTIRSQRHDFKFFKFSFSTLLVDAKPWKNKHRVDSKYHSHNIFSFFGAFTSNLLLIFWCVQWIFISLDTLCIIMYNLIHLLCQINYVKVVDVLKNSKISSGYNESIFSAVYTIKYLKLTINK